MRLIPQFLFAILSLIITGCAENIDPKSPAMIMFPELNYSQISNDTHRVLNRAAVDYNRVKSGLEPVSVTRKLLVRDGGSIIYQCDGYSIIRHHKIATQNGIDGFTVGQSLSIDSSIAIPGDTGKSETRFEAATK